MLLIIIRSSKEPVKDSGAVKSPLLKTVEHYVPVWFSLFIFKSHLQSDKQINSGQNRH